jgi:hypothetical protein
VSNIISSACQTIDLEKLCRLCNKNKVLLPYYHQPPANIRRVVVKTFFIVVLAFFDLALTFVIIHLESTPVVGKQIDNLFER